MTSTRTGLTASPSLLASQGAPLRRPSRCLALHQLRATWLTERLHHLCIKTALWRQGARPPVDTHHVGRPREKKEAAKKSPGRKKTLLRSRHHHNKTACRLRWRCADPIKGRLRPCRGPR